MSKLHKKLEPVLEQGAKIYEFEKGKSYICVVPNDFDNWEQFYHMEMPSDHPLAGCPVIRNCEFYEKYEKKEQP